MCLCRKTCAHTKSHQLWVNRQVLVEEGRDQIFQIYIGFSTFGILSNSKKKKKAQVGNEWLNILPKSSQVRKSHHHCSMQLLFAEVCSNVFLSLSYTTFIKYMTMIRTAILAVLQVPVQKLREALLSGDGDVLLDLDFLSTIPASQV